MTTIYQANLPGSSQLPGRSETPLDLLFEQFDRLITHPADIPRLNELILQLAVQGKLVPQNPADEPTANLFGSIDIEPLEDAPFTIPMNWMWARIKDVLATTQGVQIPKSSQIREYQPGYKRYLYISDFRHEKDMKYVLDKYPHKEVSETDLIMVNTGSSSGTVFYGVSGILSNNLFRISFDSNLFNQYFLYNYLKSPVFLHNLFSSLKGGAQLHLGHKLIGMQPVPLPPLAEQKRIVEKVESMLAQTRALETQLAQAGQERATLNKSALHHLLAAGQTLKVSSKESEIPATASDETSVPPSPTFETFRVSADAWQLIAANFDSLYSDPAAVDDLKQAILQLAVQGKLVPQNPADEPASLLLERIAAEKARLVKEGKIRKSKPLPPIGEDEISFEVPEGWEWVQLGNISTNIHYGYTASADFTRKDVRLLRITDIQDSKVNWETVPGCEIGESNIGKYLLEENDVLIARTGGTIGKSFLVHNVTVKAVFASYLIRVIPPKEIDSAYLKIFLDSPLYWMQLIEKSKGTGQPNVNATSLSQLTIPLPPLAEQKRIVEKVESLLGLCDTLQSQLVQGEAERSRLLASVLAGGGGLNLPGSSQLPGRSGRCDTLQSQLVQGEAERSQLLASVLAGVVD